MGAPFIARIVERSRSLLFSPLGLALVGYAAVLLLIAPWGEYPVNDDWQYAWVAKRFAETNQLKVDMRVAPSLVVQTLAAWPVLTIFGFSHLTLRLLTITAGAAVLALTDAILRTFKVHPSVRMASLAVWLLNPLFLSTSCSFMTELYGYVLALGGCLVWLHARSSATPEKPLPWGAALAAATLTGAAFWTRQLCALLFAPLWFSSALMLFLRARKDTSRSMPWLTLALSAALHGCVVAAYFPWARANNAFHNQFSQPLANLANPTHIDWQSAGLTLYGFVMYAAFFALPLLFHPTAWLQIRRNKWLIALLALFEAAGYAACASQGKPWEVLANFHQTFPVLTNIVTDFGINPITLGDRYVNHAVRPGSLTHFWGAIYAVILIANPVALAHGLRQVYSCLRDSADLRRQEACIFAVLLACGALAIVTLTFHEAVFDRYFMSSLIGVWLALALAASAHPLPSWRTWALPVLAGLPLAYYSVTSMHDYFRWNDARWALYTAAQTQGAGPLDVEGGYELNGWLLAVHQAVPPGANTGYFSGPRPFTVTLTEIAGTQTVASQRIDAWIMDMPPILLRRRLPQASPSTSSP